MAAKAARPATAIELPTVLAAPLKGVMGELVAPGAVTAPVEAAAVPEAAATPPAGTLTVEPGVRGRLPDGEADPDDPDWPLDGEPDPDEPDSPLDGEPELEPELGEPVEPAAAGVGVAVTVTKTVTGEQDGQVGHADAPACPKAGTPETGP